MLVVALFYFNLIKTWPFCSSEWNLIYSRKARVDLKFRNYYPQINALKAKGDFYDTPGQFKSELLSVVKHMSKIEPPFSLCFNPLLAYCHNHVMNMLLLRMTNLQWLTHSYKLKAKPIDMALGISMIWFQFTFQVFISHYSPPILFTWTKPNPLGVLPRLCFCSCHPLLHTNDPPTFGAQCKCCYLP